MSEKPTPKLTDILARFNDHGTKLASEDDKKSECSSKKDPESACDTDKKEETPKEASVCDSLNTMAEEAVAHHTAALQKEAALFGQFFADAVADRLQKTAQETAEQNITHQAVMSNTMQEKLASLYENAYFHTLQKLAEGEAYGMAMDQLQAPMQPVPEQGAMPVPSEIYPGMYPESIVPQEEEPLPEELLSEGDPEEAADMEPVADAVTAAAEAAREAARAANTLAENFSAEPEVSIDLPKVAQEAYDVALQALRGAGAI